MFSPNVSYRILTGSVGEEWHKEDRNNAEVVRVGYCVKFGIIRTLSERWNIGSGLSYSNIGFNTKATPLTWITSDADLPTKLRSSSRYTYIGIPILAYYKLTVNKRWGSELIFGVSLNHYINKNVISEIKINDVWTSYPNKGFIYNKFNVFGIIGIGNSYRINNKWLFKTSFILNQSFTPTNSMSKTKEYLNFVSVDIGINYRLTKTKNR